MTRQDDSPIGNPASLDWPVDWLQQAASLAMSALLARIDLNQHARPFFWVDFRQQPAVPMHAYWDYCDIAGRFIDGLILARVMTGRLDAAEPETLLRQFLWSQQDPFDGLFYNPEDDSTSAGERSKYLPDVATTQSTRHVDLFCQRAPLLALTTLLASGDESVRPRLQAMVHGLRAITVQSDDGLCMPTYRWSHRLKPEWYAGTQVPERWLGYRYALLTGLARYTQLTGDVNATDLAVGLARFYMRHGDVPGDGHFRGNTHSGGVLPTVAGIARLGIAIGDAEMIDWAHRVYLWVREQTPDFGFLLDGLGLDGFFAGTCETCGLADLQHLAILLTEAGAGDYYDDVERVARNQLIENQYRDYDALQRALPGATPDTLAMLHGGFECAAHPNHLLTWDGAEGCCIGGGLRALYLTWRACVSEDTSETRVHMGITRNTPYTEIKAFEPGAGKIEVRASGLRHVAIRTPGHACLDVVRTIVDNVDVPVTWQGRYARFENLRPGQVAAITYPVPERSQAYHIAGTEYMGIWRGHAMIEIQPAGERYPIYHQRAWINGSQPDAPELGLSHSALNPATPVLW